MEYCARCGEKSRDFHGAWFILDVGVTSARAARLLKTFNRYPGPVVKVGKFLKFTVSNAAQIDWVREQTGKLLFSAGTSLTGPTGTRCTSDDPVFKCMMGVMDSRLRGCMTQMARPSVCADEAALLPLRETMKNASLADQLHEEKRSDLAQRLTLGVIASLSSRNRSVHCPLFGTALRLLPADRDRLPLLLADLVAEHEAGNMVFPFYPAGRKDTAVPSVQPAHDDPGRPPSLKETVVGSIKSKDDGLDKLPRYHQIKIAEGAVIGSHPRSATVRSVDFLWFEGPDQIAKRTTLHCDSIDISDRVVSVLAVKGNQFRVAEASRKLKVMQLGAWRGGDLPEVEWGLIRNSESHYWVWSHEGAIMYLTPQRGWLLSPVQGHARYRELKSSQDDLSGVVNVCSCGSGIIAVLSAAGHRLTVLKGLKAEAGDEHPPVKRLFDAILPMGTTGMSSEGDGRIQLAFDNRGVKLSWDRNSQETVVACSSLESIACLGPGGFLVTEVAGTKVYGPVSPDVPVDTELETITTRLAERAQADSFESLTILDRHGRLPHATTWGK